MMQHQSPHPKANQVVKLKKGTTHPQYDLDGVDFYLEDWWDHLTGGSWKYADGNPACLIYAIRAGMTDLPRDDEVVYGKVNGMGVLIHSSEIEED